LFCLMHRGETAQVGLAHHGQIVRLAFLPHPAPGETPPGALSPFPDSRAGAGAFGRVGWLGATACARGSPRGSFWPPDVNLMGNEYRIRVRRRPKSHQEVPEEKIGGPNSWPPRPPRPVPVAAPRPAVRASLRACCSTKTAVRDTAPGEAHHPGDTMRYASIG